VATYAFIHGAGDVGWYWHLVAEELAGRGHDAVAPDLPCDDDSAGWSEYAEAVIEAVGGRTDLVVVAQSLGGFTAPLVADRVPSELIVLVAGMIPTPGETGGEWWSNTGYRPVEGIDQEDLVATFMHDVPPELAAEALKRTRDQSSTPMGQPWPLDAWPDVPTRYLLCSEDRFFRAEWLRGLVRERLAVAPDDIASGHTPALSHPKELADRLDSFRADP
jgi:pimeloyl-ACP methyl ester carboxylesterase